MTFLGGRGKLDLSSYRRDYNAFLVETRWIWIGIGFHSYAGDEYCSETHVNKADLFKKLTALTTLRLALVHTFGTRV